MSGTGGPRLLLVVAHPDDETFGCGSLLLHAAAAGATTTVCCATRGEAGTPAPGTGIEAGELGRVREAELRAAARLLGVHRVELLGFVDSGTDGPAATDTLVGAPFSDVSARVLACVEECRPDVLVTLDASDGHRDHARIRDATLAAARRSSRAIDRVYLYCLPRELMRRWLEHAGATLGTQVPGTPEEQITTVIDVSEHLPARQRAIAAHASQVSPYAGLPEDLRLAFLTADRLQRVSPAWLGGAVETDIFR